MQESYENSSPCSFHLTTTITSETLKSPGVNQEETMGHPSHPTCNSIMEYRTNDNASLNQTNMRGTIHLLIAVNHAPQPRKGTAINEICIHPKSKETLNNELEIFMIQTSKEG